MMGEDRGWEKTKVAFTSPGTHGLSLSRQIQFTQEHIHGTFTLEQRKLDGGDYE